MPGGISNACRRKDMRLFNCLAAAIPPQERVLTAEEVFELKIPLPDAVSL
jgi:pilus assembly protein CpaF